MKIRFVEFAIIPLLIVGYLYFVDLLVANNFGIPGLTQQEKAGSPGATVVSLGEAVSIVAMRPYFGGLIRLPTYAGSIGYIGWMHDLFFNFIIVLTIGFVLFEIYLTVRGNKEVSFMKTETKWGQTKGFNWMRLAKAAGIGIVFGIVTLIISGDTASIPLGLLVAYMEFRFAD